MCRAAYSNVRLQASFAPGGSFTLTAGFARRADAASAGLGSRRVRPFPRGALVPRPRPRARAGRDHGEARRSSAKVRHRFRARENRVRKVSGVLQGWRVVGVEIRSRGNSCSDGHGGCDRSRPVSPLARRSCRWPVRLGSAEGWARRQGVAGAARYPSPDEARALVLNRIRAGLRARVAVRPVCDTRFTGARGRRRGAAPAARDPRLGAAGPRDRWPRRDPRR